MIFTESAFYYGTEITEDNQAIQFIEGETLTATCRVGKYSLTGLANEVARAMNEAGSLDYAVSVNRQTRVFTLSAAGPFTIVTGSLLATDIGFTGANKTGASSYVGSTPVGESYRPQFRLQGYVDFEHNQKSVDSTVNTSASGQVEVVRFGTYKLMECEIKFITDIDQGEGAYLRTNPTGVSDARAFLEYAISKGPMEFVPDISSNGFTKCILESTSESTNGVDFKLKELFAQGLVGYYTTGLLTFRKVN